MKTKREKKQYQIPEVYIGIPISKEVREALLDSAETEAKQKKWFENHGIQKSLSDAHSFRLLCPAPTLCEQYEEKDLIERLLGEVGKLSDYERLLIQKRFYDELSLEAIAKDVGASVSTVHARIAAIVKRLSMKLKD